MIDIHHRSLSKKQITNLLISYRKSFFRSAVIMFAMVLISGCSGLVSQKTGQHSISSSLTSFLKSGDKSNKFQKPEITQLKLPVKVGLAFLPSQHWRGRTLDESSKYQLLRKVKNSFSQHRFIESISIIPSSYLKHHGSKTGNGFDTLKQVANIHDVDIIALVSYDQLTRSQQNNASLLYWTIVGMYVIPGNENSIQTFIDTAVFDVRSRKLLMRAPGVSKLTKRSTAIGVDSVMMQKSLQGFDLAFDDMIKNLDIELSRFMDRVQQGNSVKITNQQAYSAAGNFNNCLSLFLLSIVVFRRFRTRIVSTVV